MVQARSVLLGNTRRNHHLLLKLGLCQGLFSIFLFQEVCVLKGDLNVDALEEAVPQRKDVLFLWKGVNALERKITSYLSSPSY